MTVPRGGSKIFGLLGLGCGIFKVDLRNYPPLIVGGPQPIAAVDNR